MLPHSETGYLSWTRKSMIAMVATAAHPNSVVG